MIRFLKGRYYQGQPGEAIIENGSGMGFRVFVPVGSSLYQTSEGDEVKVYTSMKVREDDISLYGFDDMDSLELFELLITVNGVGAKAGMAIMSVMSPNQVRKAIATEDVKSLKKADGIGKKTAERIILELKDKVGTFEDDGGIQTEDLYPSQIQDGPREEAQLALRSLGYTAVEIETAMRKIKGEGLSAEEYIKEALRRL